jgi:hypothetical protein
MQLGLWRFQQDKGLSHRFSVGVPEFLKSTSSPTCLPSGWVPPAAAVPVEEALAGGTHCSQLSSSRREEGHAQTRQGSEQHRQPEWALTWKVLDKGVVESVA